MGGRTSRWIAATTSGRLLVGVSAAVVVSFLVATVLSQRLAAKIDDDAQSIITNAMPSVQYLSAARTDLHRVDAAAERYAAARMSGTTPDPTWLDAPRRDLNSAIETYLALPFYPGERELYKGTADAIGHLDEEIGAVKNLRIGAGSTPSEVLRQVRDATVEVDVKLQHQVDFDAAQGQMLSSEIATLRRRSARIAYSLNIASVLLAIAATALAVTQVRRLAALLRELERTQRDRADLLEQRCVELEQFADRVAHDIMSPLAGVSIALAVAQKTSGSDPTAKRAIDRGTQTLLRVRRMVDGLLDFARSGGRPSARFETDVRAVLDDVVEGVRGDAEERNIEVGIDPFPPCSVKCSQGVLTSLVSNLVRNAIKYMGASEVRRILLRATDSGDRWRISVQDTGPGVPSEKKSILFEPYVRADSKQPGIGLGLATVKRLADAHGGAVGVESSPGGGSTFWFELPKADGEVTQGRDSMLVASTANRFQS
jgi:signal transduction histidine kinase